MMTYKCVKIVVIEVYHLRKVHTRKHVSLRRAAERRRRVCRDKVNDKVNDKTKVKVNDKTKVNNKGPDQTKVNDKVKSKVRRYFE